MFGFDALSEAAVRLFWGTAEAEEAKTAFKEKRKPDFSAFK
jgi:1,4-dihydroxy-2-naphthoyl-CoA synthase